MVRKSLNVSLTSNKGFEKLPANGFINRRVSTLIQYSPFGSIFKDNLAQFFPVNFPAGQQDFFSKVANNGFPCCFVWFNNWETIISSAVREKGGFGSYTHAILSKMD